MERELEFLKIDGQFYGADQGWYRSWWMRLAGCSTTTACEACICLARSSAAMRSLYPGDAWNVSKTDFQDFAERMFPYVHPGVGGLTDVGRYADMLRSYTDSVGVEAAVDVLAGSAGVDDAAHFIVSAVNDGRPAACLVLQHRDASFEDFIWHWFTVTGYRETPGGLEIVAATEGRRHVLPLPRLWETGYARKGGLASLRTAGAG